MQVKEFDRDHVSTIKIDFMFRLLQNFYKLIRRIQIF